MYTRHALFCYIFIFYNIILHIIYLLIFKYGHIYTKRIQLQNIYIYVMLYTSLCIMSYLTGGIAMLRETHNHDRFSSDECVNLN